MGLKIRNVWTPDVIENGTQVLRLKDYCFFSTKLRFDLQQSALVDCDFTYEQKDLQSLELKWYFR